MDAARRYADALAGYWTARAELDALRQGRLPALGVETTDSGPASPPTMQANDH